MCCRTRYTQILSSHQPASAITESSTTAPRVCIANTIRGIYSCSLPDQHVNTHTKNSSLWHVDGRKNSETFASRTPPNVRTYICHSPTMILTSLKIDCRLIWQPFVLATSAIYFACERSCPSCFTRCLIRTYTHTHMIGGFWSILQWDCICHLSVAYA